MAADGITWFDFHDRRPQRLASKPQRHSHHTPVETNNGGHEAPFLISLANVAGGVCASVSFHTKSSSEDVSDVALTHLVGKRCVERDLCLRGHVGPDDQFCSP